MGGVRQAEVPVAGPARHPGLRPRGGPAEGGGAQQLRVGRSDALDPIAWDAFRKKYLDTRTPATTCPPSERQEAQKAWAKSWASCRSERLALDNFERLVEGRVGATR